MNPVLVWKLLRKELALGPRSAIFMWAVLLPFALTLILQVAFGSLFDPEPRLGVVDDGDSAITEAVTAMDGITVVLPDDAAELRSMVEANDLDAGIVLPAGFDDAVRAGERPELQFWVGGESLASNRIILSVTTIDLVRALEGGDAPVAVEVVSLGRDLLPISTRLVPVIVFYALVMAGLFLPGSSLVEEKEQGTLGALLVTPVRTSEILAAKWLMGVVLASIMAVVTLALNRAIAGSLLGIVVVVLVAAALSTVVGLLVGVAAKDSTVMFAIVKGMGLFLFAPVLFYIFPDWPQWIAMIFPMYWIIEPIWQVSVMGEALSSVALELGVAVAITVVLAVAAAALARRMQAQLAGA
ncbi:MAG: ABC transporter permease [Actinomycetes bacterium]|nr:ABC transporter permease [Actinomycetes bacterium]MDX5381342.1 ABC transporter permease [Actinomycetes bacterium]MDX5400742.1 ABC transporter permease [Actinomycetes bacterium]MDX5451118.1 ABC transporter permease [Actinomycetes bacterium]